VLNPLLNPSYLMENSSPDKRKAVLSELATLVREWVRSDNPHD
jgi:hypothetical protein